jgi:hypothetical protein
MADIDPCIGKQVFHFKLEDFVVDENVLVHFRRTYQRLNGLGVITVVHEVTHGLKFDITPPLAARFA